MAQITGKITKEGGILNINHDDTLLGTASDDTIDALSGNDTIYAGAGTDVVRAGAGSDTIWATSFGNRGVVGAWGNDTVYGGGGVDHINYAMTTNSVTLYGDDTTLGSADGDDTIYGGSGADMIVGGGGHDWLEGGANNDVIYGDIDSGRTTSGGGNDTLLGGAGSDQLYGGGGFDTFAYRSGDSAPTYAGSDVIKDFASLYDSIWFIGGAPAATVNNYLEDTIAPSSGNMSKDFNAAAAYAEQMLDFKDYVFLTNGTQGYLFADVNHDGTADYGMELKGLTALSSFSYADILT
jgi:Ca2+-binding RTX toxin-like protein